MYGDNLTIVAHVTMLDTVTYIKMMKMTYGVHGCDGGNGDDDVEEAKSVYGDNVTIVAHVAMLDTVTYIMMMKMTCGVQCCEGE